MTYSFRRRRHITDVALFSYHHTAMMTVISVADAIEAAAGMWNNGNKMRKTAGDVPGGMERTMNRKTFYINDRIIYNEMSVQTDSINKFYEIHNPDNERIVAIPDGCIDIQYVWKNGIMHPQLCGSFMQGKVSRIGDYDYCFGVKFNPGQLPDWIKADASKLMEAREDLSKYSGCRSSFDISCEATFAEKIEHFTSEYDCSADMTDKRVMTMYVVNKIDENKGYVNINELVGQVGYSHCYTDRVFKNAVGLSMKQYANIVRLQQSLDILGNNNTADVCNDLGYYDQSHFIKDFKKFTLMTPKAYYRKSSEERFV